MADDQQLLESLLDARNQLNRRGDTLPSLDRCIAALMDKTNESNGNPPTPCEIDMERQLPQDGDDLDEAYQRWENERMPLGPSIVVGKRLGIYQSLHLDDWWVGYSPRNGNSYDEGPWEEWVSLAREVLARNEGMTGNLSVPEQEKSS